MQAMLARIFILFSLLLTFSLPALAADTYILDPGHTYALWHINHFGFSHPSGKWYAEGTLVLDETKPQDSKVDVIIHIANIDTGISKLDEHLLSADFFDVAKYPTASFASNKINVTGKNTAKIYGTLTLHGVSKPVILNVMLNKIGVSPITSKKTAGFTATTQIKRSDFGMVKYLPGLADEVKINIEAEGKLKEFNDN